MEIEILAIGDPLKIKPIVADFLHSQKNNSFLVSVPKKLQKFIISCFATEGIKAIPLPLYAKILTPHKDPPSIHKLPSTVFNWLKTGASYFHLTYNNRFEVLSLDRRVVKTVSKVEGITKCFMSNNGAIYAFIKGNALSFCMGDELDLIYDTKLEDLIGEVYFSEDDRTVGVESGNFVYIYDIFRGLIMKKFHKERFSIIEEGSKVYLHDSGRYMSLEGGDSAVSTASAAGTASAVSAASTHAASTHAATTTHATTTHATTTPTTHAATSTPPTAATSTPAKPEIVLASPATEYFKGKIAKFETCNSQQKISYNSNGKITSKTVSHVTEVRFFFSKSRLYVALTKNPGSGNFYALESYADGQVTSLNLESRIEEIAVEDDYVVIQLSDRTVEFYSRERHAFGLLARVSKEGEAILSQCGELSGVYDAALSNIEFYDRGRLRTMYRHRGCAGISWSPNSLYAASYSLNESGGGLVQVFNNNGVLVYKKVYNGLEKFGWRGDKQPSEEEAKKIVSEHKGEEVEEKDEDEDKDKELLLKEWKEYLGRFIK